MDISCLRGYLYDFKLFKLQYLHPLPEMCKMYFKHKYDVVKDSSHFWIVCLQYNLIKVYYCLLFQKLKLLLFCWQTLWLYENILRGFSEVLEFLLLHYSKPKFYNNLIQIKTALHFILKKVFSKVKCNIISCGCERFNNSYICIFWT